PGSCLRPPRHLRLRQWKAMRRSPGRAETIGKTFPRAKKSWSLRRKRTGAANDRPDKWRKTKRRRRGRIGLAGTSCRSLVRLGERRSRGNRDLRILGTL